LKIFYENKYLSKLKNIGVYFVENTFLKDLIIDKVKGEDISLLNIGKN
jgi:hypothetical protein